MTDQGCEVFQGLVEGHEAVSTRVALEVLFNGLLGVKLHTQGKRLVGALDGLNDVHAIGGRDTRNPQGRARHVAHDLVMPRGYVMDDTGARNGIEQRGSVGDDDVVGRIVALALGIALHSVQEMVIFAHFIEEFAHVLNERGA